MPRPGRHVRDFSSDPLNPTTRSIANTCAFDKDAILLKGRDSETLLHDGGFGDISTRYIFSIPPAGPLLRKVDRLSSLPPFGSQYYMLGTNRYYSLNRIGDPD